MAHNTTLPPASSTTTTERSIPAATRAALDLLGQRWVAQLLYLLLPGEARFTELAHALPDLSHRVLTDRLRCLADQGLIQRTVADGPPTRITYKLTDLGEELRDTFTELDRWAHLDRN